MEKKMKWIFGIVALAVISAGVAGWKSLARGDQETKNASRQKENPVEAARPHLELGVNPHWKQWGGRVLIYTFTVTNSGDAPAAKGTITDVLPAAYRFSSADCGARFDGQTNTVSWALGNVDVKETKEVH